MAKDKLLYSYLGAWNSNVLDYSKLFPHSLILHPRKKSIIHNGTIYGGTGIPCIIGNSTGTPGTWIGTSDDISEYYEGLSIIYIPYINGSTTTTLNINNLGAKTVFINNTQLSTEYKSGCPILLTYISGTWKASDYNDNDVNLVSETDNLTTSYYLTMTGSKEGYNSTYTTSYVYYQNKVLHVSYLDAKLNTEITLWGQNFDLSNNIKGDLSDVGNIIPENDISYNIGSSSLRFSNVYGQRFVGRADTVASSKDNITKFYFVGVTGSNQPLKYDDGIYTSNNSGNLFTKRLYINSSAENLTYNLYVNGKGFVSGSFEADKIINKNYDNSYVLLAGGNVKSIASFNVGDYLPLVGGTMTGDIKYSDGTNTSYFLREGNVGLYVGGNGNLTSNETTINGNTYITFKAKDTYFKHNIVGGTGINVTSDANGKITITNNSIHKITHLYIGAINTNANSLTSNGDTYIKLFDDMTISHQYNIKGTGATTVSSDINGNITINSTNTDTHWTSYLRVGEKDTNTTAATTNGNTYLKLIENGNIRENQIKLVGTGVVSVTSDANGVITINGTALTSQYNTHLYFGNSIDSNNANVAVSNPYLKLYDDSTLRHKYQFISGSGISISSDANGNVTFTNTSVGDHKVNQNQETANNEYRILLKYTNDDTNETNYVKYNTKFRYNPSTGNIFNNGNFYIDTGDNDRFIQFRYNSNNYAGAAWRLMSRGSGSGDANYFDIETGGSDANSNTWYRVIRLTMDNRRVGIGIDSPSDKLDVDGYIRSTANSRYLQIGPQNTSLAHYNTNADTGHYFNKAIYVDGDIYIYGTNTRMQKSNGYVYASGFNHNGINSNDYVILAAGSYKQWTIGNTANALVARDSNGYVYAGYYNSAISDENSITIGSVYVRNNSDNWIRRMGLSDFVSQINSNDTVSFTKSLKVTQDWMDADIDITTTNFPKGNGTYAIMIDATSISNGTDFWPSIYSGVMTIYTSGTNGSITNEIILHRDGYENAKRLYLRTCQRASSNSKLQIAASVAFSTAYNLIFKFRKLI